MPHSPSLELGTDLLLEITDPPVMGRRKKKEGQEEGGGRGVDMEKGEE